jgi:hypothetical protein
VRGASRPFWAFQTGTTTSDDTVRVRPGARSFVNCAVQAFYAFTIVYDDVARTMTFIPDPG